MNQQRLRSSALMLLVGWHEAHPACKKTGAKDTNNKSVDFLHTIPKGSFEQQDEEN